MITIFLTLITFMIYVMIGAKLVSWLRTMVHKLPNSWYPIIGVLWPISMPILLIIGSIFIMFYGEDDE